MSNGAVSVAVYFYFHKDNGREIKALWAGLAEKAGVEVGDSDAVELVNEQFNSHGLTNLKTLQGPGSQIYISLHKNIVVVSGLFSGTGGWTDLSSLPDIDSAIGRAKILIDDEAGLEDFESTVGRRYSLLETGFGRLHQFEEKKGNRVHTYYLAPREDSAAVEHFLTLDFPLFDFAIHKLHMERDYFKNQQKWIMNEKAEIDKEIGDLLHKSIVGETLNPEFIGSLERDIDTLSSKYAILVNDGHLIRKARTTLEEDVELVLSRLKGFGTVPEGGLEITRASAELIDRLREEETSISFAIKNIKTAIDTVRTSVELLRSRENIHLQEEAISFQVAAGVLEFIIIFYYSIASWDYIIGVERFDTIPPYLRFLTIFVFAALSVAMTHFVGISFKKKWQLNRGLILSATALLAVFAYIVFLSIQTAALHAA